VSRNSGPSRPPSTGLTAGTKSPKPIQRFIFTLRGKPILTFYWKPGTDGWSLLGVSDPDPDGAHLSTAFLNGKFRTHLTDPKAENPEVMGKVQTPDYLGKRLSPRYKRALKPYRSNQTAWTMTSALKRKVARILPRIAGESVIVPFEAYLTEIRLNFGNSKRWRKTRIRDLVGKEETFVYIREGGRDYLIRPINEKFLVRFTHRGLDSLVNIWAGPLGLDEYLEYIGDRIGPELRRRVYAAIR